MDRATQASLTREIQRHLRDGTNALAAGELLNPVDEYTDPGRFGRERDAYFHQLPVIVGHASRLAEPGAFLTADVAGMPVLVVRQRDGSLRAFANVCRHRGSKVVEDECGSARAFRCPYHAWTYGLDGALRAVPESGAFPDLDLAERGLVPLPAEERHGLVWVAAAPDAKIDVAAHLGALDGELAAYGMDDYVEERREELRDRLNWKLVVDGFLEVYHLPSLHPSTAGSLIRGRPSFFEPLGRHGRLVAVRKDLEAVEAADPDGFEVLPHLAVVYQIFPNSILIWQADHFELWSIAPDGPDPAHSVARASLLAPAAEAARSDHWDKNWKVLMDTVRFEDFRIGRGIQLGFEAGVQDHIVFGRNEPALHHYHRTLRAELPADAP